MKGKNTDIKNIFEAAEKGKHETIKVFLAQPGANANAQNRHGESALLIAASHGHIESVNVLLAHGADVNAKNEKGVTPLMAASANGHIEVVKAILGAENQALNIDDAIENNNTALRSAIRWGHTEIVKMLLDAGATIHPECLESAANKYRFKIFGMLISTQAKRNFKYIAEKLSSLVPNIANISKESLKSLLYLTLFSLIATLLILSLVVSPMVSVPVIAGIITACVIVHSFAIYKLVTAMTKTPEIAEAVAIEPNMSQAENLKAAMSRGKGQKPVMSRYASEEELRSTPNADAKVVAATPQGEVLPSKNGGVAKHPEPSAKIDMPPIPIASEISQKGRKAKNTANDVGHSMLKAAASGNAEEVAKLLQGNENVNYKNEQEQTALIAAAANGHDEIVRMLLASGADVDAVNEDGSTALIVAAENGHARIVRMLLEAGAYVNVKNKEGLTALRAASKALKDSTQEGKEKSIQSRHDEVCLILRTHMAIDAILLMGATEVIEVVAMLILFLVVFPHAQIPIIVLSVIGLFIANAFIFAGLIAITYPPEITIATTLDEKADQNTKKLAEKNEQKIAPKTSLSKAKPAEKIKTKGAVTPSAPPKEDEENQNESTAEKAPRPPPPVGK